MPWVLPMYQFEISDNRLDKAVMVIRNARKMITEDQCLNVIRELGWDGSLTYDDSGNLQIEMTDVQLVATAAAIAAVGENGGRLKKND